MTEEFKKNQYEAAQGYMLLAVLLKTVGGYPSVTEGLNPLITQKSQERNKWMKEGMQMSDFEILSLMLMILGIIVSILIELIKSTKK